MGVGDWLKEVLKNNSLIKINFNIDLSKLQSIKFFSDNNINNTTLERDEQNPKVLVVKVNPQKIYDSPQELEAVKQMLRLSVPNEGGLYESETDKLIDEVSVFQSTGDGDELLVKLKGKMPDSDLPIWEAALFIKQAHERGERVDKLKQGLRYRFGERGGNIANLCSAGYLEEIILPIYDELSQRPAFSIDQFHAQYEVIVTQYPFAVFVAWNSEDADILKEIQTKIEYNKNYGIHQLNIHTIGKDNIRKVLAILDHEEVKSLFSTAPRLLQDGDVLNAVIYF